MAWKPVIAGTLLEHYLAGKLAVGSFGRVHKVITQADIQAYANLLGDSNPVHTDPAYAARSAFGRPIAHGLIAAGLIPTVFGATIQGSIYVSQSLKFKQPLFVDDEAQCTVTVTGVRGVGRGPQAQPGAGPRDADGEDKGKEPATASRLLVTCDTVVRRMPDGIVIIDGSATVLIPGYRAAAGAAGAAGASSAPSGQAAAAVQMR